MVVWIYAHLLAVGGPYNGKVTKIQISCFTDGAGPIDVACTMRQGDQITMAKPTRGPVRRDQLVYTFTKELLSGSLNLGVLS